MKNKKLFEMLTAIHAFYETFLTHDHLIYKNVTKANMVRISHQCLNSIEINSGFKGNLCRIAVRESSAPMNVKSNIYYIMKDFDTIYKVIDEDIEPVDTTMKRAIQKMITDLVNVSDSIEFVGYLGREHEIKVTYSDNSTESERF